MEDHPVQMMILTILISEIRLEINLGKIIF